MAGLTADGFVARTLEEIQQGFVDQQRANIDAALDTSQFELIGQLNGIMAASIAEVWELARELHDAMDPDKAVGEQQDALYSLTSTPRGVAVKSTVVATVVLATGASIAINTAQASVAGNPEAKFVNLEAMINAGAPGSFPITFEALEAGPVIANAGTLTHIDTPLSGWTSITNAQDATIGREIESDVGYRVRRERELAAQGGGTVPGLRADLLRLPYVRAAIVLENTTLVAANGLPAKSFEAIVRSDDGADDDDAIASTIWINKAAGMQPFGVISVDVLDADEGQTHAVSFSRPTERAVYVALRLLTNPAAEVPYAGDAATKTAIVAAGEDSESTGYLEVGADVYAGQFIATAMRLPGVLNVDARVSFSPIVDFAAAAVSLVTDRREIATLDTSRITIGGLPMITHVTDHVDRGVSRLIERYRLPLISALLASWLSEVQLVEDALWALLTERSIATASGARLDVLGKLVGQPREGRRDSVYRVWISARALVNRSSGKTSQLIAITKKVTDQAAMRLEEFYPAHVTVHVDDPIDLYAGGQIAKLLIAAKAAGVGLHFHWGEGVPFKFAPGDVSVLSSPYGFGAGRFSAISDGSDALTPHLPSGVLGYDADGDPLTEDGEYLVLG